MIGIWTDPAAFHDPPVRHWTADMEIVARRVEVPWPAMQQALACATVAGALRFDGPFVPLGDDTVAVTGRLAGLRRARVTIEATSWGDRAGELRVLPRSRHVGRWGRRRQQRYFALAHAAADGLRAHIDRSVRVFGSQGLENPHSSREGAAPASLEAARCASATRVSVGL